MCSSVTSAITAVIMKQTFLSVLAAASLSVFHGQLLHLSPGLPPYTLTNTLLQPNQQGQDREATSTHSTTVIPPHNHLL